MQEDFYIKDRHGNDYYTRINAGAWRVIYWFAQEKNNLLTLADLHDGFSTFLKDWEELKIDIPEIFQYTAEVMAVLFCSPNFEKGEPAPLKLAELTKMCAPMIESNVFHEVLTKLLHKMHEQLSARVVGDLWKEAGFDWRQILPSTIVDPNAFVKDNGLEFTIEQSPATKEVLSFDDFTDKLQKILEQSVSSSPTGSGRRRRYTSNLNNEIFDFIDDHVNKEDLGNPDFVRALSTAIFRSSFIFEPKSINLQEEDLLTKVTVLKRYIESNEIQVLYAIQLLMHTLQHPQGVMARVLEMLYDEAVVSEETFIAWKEDTPQFADGHGIALKSCTQVLDYMSSEPENCSPPSSDTNRLASSTS